MPVCPRIVLLLDDDSCDGKEIIARTHLGCLRILSYFSHHFNHSNIKSPLLWGYKFYSSRSYRKGGPYRKHQFLDYTTENFDKFETELYERFSKTTKINENKKLHSGEKLKTALTELLSDFQWDRPELISPGKRRGGSFTLSESNTINFVFLFSYCPVSNPNDCTYFQQKYTDASSFIDTLFPNMLYTKFANHLKIGFCWVDTACSIMKTVKYCRV